MSVVHTGIRQQLVLHILHRRQQRCKAIEDQKQKAIDDRVREIYIHLAHLWSSFRRLEATLDECNQQVEAATIDFMIGHGIRIGEDL